MPFSEAFHTRTADEAYRIGAALINSGVVRGRSQCFLFEAGVKGHEAAHGHLISFSRDVDEVTSLLALAKNLAAPRGNGFANASSNIHHLAAAFYVYAHILQTKCAGYVSPLHMRQAGEKMDELRLQRFLSDRSATPEEMIKFKDGSELPKHLFKWGIGALSQEKHTHHL